MGVLRLELLGGLCPTDVESGGVLLEVVVVKCLLGEKSVHDVPSGWIADRLYRSTLRVGRGQRPLEPPHPQYCRLERHETVGGLDLGRRIALDDHQGWRSIVF